MEWQRPHRQVYIWLAILGICFFAGNLCGGIFLALTDTVALEEMRDFLDEYFRLFLEGSPHLSFFSGLLVRFGQFAVLVVCCVLPVAEIAVPFFFTWRGFLLGFSNACLYSLFGRMGLLLSGVLFLIPATLWFPAQLICSLWVFSGRKNGEKNSGKRILVSREGALCLGICLALTVLCAWVEFSLLPPLLGGISRVWLY